MGKKNYTNGVITKRFGEDDVIPEGWYRGVAPMSEEKKREMVEKRKKTNLAKYGVENPSQSQEIKDKKKATTLKNYGVANPAESKEVQKKMKKTALERYGVENASQAQEVKDKKKATTLSHFGVEHPMQSKEVQEKSKETVMEKYGVEHISQTREYKERYKKTNLEKYGVENPMQSEEVKEKLKSTNLARYGVEWSCQADVAKEKSRQTNLAKHGAEYSFQSDEVKEKIKATNLEKYGVENPFASDEIKERIKSTNISKYGASYPMQAKFVQNKSKETSLKKYGTEYPNQSDEVRKKILASTLEHYGVEYPAQLEEIRDKMRNTTYDRYGVDYRFLSTDVRVGHSKDSKPNLNFAKALDSKSIPYTREFHLGGYLYDFKVGNILVEIDPSITHNTAWSPFGEHKGLSENYHRDKSLCAEKSGYRCIHVFDWDNVDVVLNLLGVRDRVYARNCDLREVPLADTEDFLRKYHLQGSCKGQSVRLGLYYNNELVSIMTFGKPRYNKNYEWELLRYCSSKLVVGGAEKLFKEFVQKHNPKSIISYCDKSKFSGDVYMKLGFKGKNHVSLSRHWYSYKEKRHITDNLLRQKGYDNLFNKSYGKGTSNEELMLNRGYLPLYDCGQDVWVYEV